MEGRIAGDAGVVDQNADRAKFVGNRFHQRARGLDIADIAGEYRYREAVGFHLCLPFLAAFQIATVGGDLVPRSEEHTSELQSLMRISYAVFCLKKKTITDA